MATAQEQRRQPAIARYRAGDPLEDICREWACAKSWLSKWRERSLATDPSWSAARSRSPRTSPTKTSPPIEQALGALRHTLAQQGQDGGAAFIQQALTPQGRASVPSQRPLDRMRHRSAKEVT